MAEVFMLFSVRFFNVTCDAPAVTFTPRPLFPAAATVAASVVLVPVPYTCAPSGDAQPNVICRDELVRMHGALEGTVAPLTVSASVPPPEGGNTLCAHTSAEAHRQSCNDV